jgi:hypothetical protein
MTDEEKKTIQLEPKEKKQRQPEVTPESLEERQQMLDFAGSSADELAAKSKQLKKERRGAEIELRSGEIIPYIVYISVNSLQEYFALFPNSNPYFSEMFRLAGWTLWDPNKYIKPLEAKQYLIETIYYRFHKEMVPALKEKAVPGKHKLFQLLNNEGLEKMKQFRDEAVEMMRDFEDGQIYEFRFAYAQKYKTAMQLKLIL